MEEKRKNVTNLGLVVGFIEMNQDAFENFILKEHGLGEHDLETILFCLSGLTINPFVVKKR